MKSAKLTSVVASVFAFALSLAVVGCSAESEAPEEQGESTSNLSCSRVPTERVIAGRVVKTTKVVCGKSADDGATRGTSTSSCTVNGRKLTCEGGGCRAVNGQPGEGCRFVDDDGADAPAPEQTPPPAPPAPPPAEAPADEQGESTCTINGRKAVCDDGSCVAINGQPGPGCRFVE